MDPLGFGPWIVNLDRMVHILRLILTQMVLSLRSRAELQVENLALRHQLEILKRSSPKRARLTKVDRFIITWLCRMWPKAVQSIRIVHPKTLLRWHREGFRIYWRWKSRRRGGRPRAPTEIRALIRQLSAQNPLWGAPRIYGELLKLGFDISQATVSSALTHSEGTGMRLILSRMVTAGLVQTKGLGMSLCSWM